MELSDIFPSRYVKASDLKKGTPVVVIARAEIEKVGDDQKLVIYFQNKEKGLVCNRTNADRIAFLHGSNTDNWIGKEIMLATELVSFQGKTQPAIRVQPAPKREAQSQNGGYVQREGYSINEPAKPRPSMKDGLEEIIGRSPSQDAPF